RLVAHRLVEVELGGVEDEVGEHHVLGFADGPSARVDDDVAHLEVLEVGVAAGETLPFELVLRQPGEQTALPQIHPLPHDHSPRSSRIRRAITSYWISDVPSKMRNTLASRQ